MTTPDVVLEAGQVWTNGVTTVTIQAIQVEICRTPRAYYAVRVLSEKRTSGVFVNDSGDLFDLARGIVRDGLQLADSQQQEATHGNGNG